MPKAALFDIDGVLIHYDQYFSRTLSSNDFINPSEILDSYFKTDCNLKCDKGLSSPYIEIKPYLDKIGWNGSAEDFFSMQWAWEKDRIDFKLLDAIEKIRSKNLYVFIASNQNKERKNFLVKSMNIAKIFHGSFFSCDIGYVKSEHEYWNTVISELEKMGVGSSEILFFDDLDINIKMASEHGIDSRLVIDRTNIWEYVQLLLS